MFSITRKRIAVVSTIAVMGLGGGIAYAYYSATGSGSGSGTAGTASTATVNQTAAACLDYSAWNTSDALGVGTCNLFPGTTQAVHLTVTNNGKGTQHINQVTLTGWSSLVSGCDSTSLPGSFTMSPVTINETPAGGATTGSHDGSISFVSTGISQNACQGAAITFTYASS
jgi:hypothetical protein